MPAELDRCVEALKRSGKSEESAYAICNARLKAQTPDFRSLTTVNNNHSHNFNVSNLGTGRTTAILPITHEKHNHQIDDFKLSSVNHTHQLIKMTQMARGEGQGVGNPKQNDGGTDICVCTKCGYEIKHDRGIPCNEIKCSKCGTPMAGKVQGSTMKIKDLLQGEV